MRGCVVQSVSVATDGASSWYVTCDAADWQVPAVHLYPRLNIRHHVGVCVEPDTEVIIDPYNAVLRTACVHRLSSTATVHEASSRGTES